MSINQTKQNQSKLLSIQTNANGGNGNKPPSSDDGLNEDEGFKHINYPIEGTPFKVMGNERDGFILVMGKHRLSDPVGTPTEAEQLLEDKPYQIMFHMVATMLEINEDLRINTLAETESLK